MQHCAGKSWLLKLQFQGMLYGVIWCQARSVLRSPKTGDYVVPAKNKEAGHEGPGRVANGLSGEVSQNSRNSDKEERGIVEMKV